MITERSAAEDVAAILETGGLGNVGVDVFINTGRDFLSSPDSMVIVSDYPFHRPPDPNGDYEYCMVQVIVRRKAFDLRGGVLKVLGLMDALNAYCGTVSAIRYSGIFIQSGFLYLGEDDKGRPSWSFNVEAQRTTA